MFIFKAFKQAPFRVNLLIGIYRSKVLITNLVVPLVSRREETP